MIEEETYKIGPWLFRAATLAEAMAHYAKKCERDRRYKEEEVIVFPDGTTETLKMEVNW